jgi:hypothetical protein
MTARLSIKAGDRLEILTNAVLDRLTKCHSQYSHLNLTNKV